MEFEKLVDLEGESTKFNNCHFKHPRMECAKNSRK